MKKLITSIGVVVGLGVGAFALNTVMPASAGTLADQAAASCTERTTVQDVLDKLVQDGTIDSDQKDKIVDALKAARESNMANRPNRPHPLLGIRVRAIEGAFEVSADKIGVSVEELKDAVKGGQSVADVANAHNVQPSDVESAIVDAATAKIDAAVSSNKLSQERADALKSKLPDLANKFVNHKGAGC